MLAAAGVGTQPGELDGVDLLPFLSGQKDGPPHEALYWRFWGQAAVREGKWKLIELENGVRLLFDMESSEHENKNRIDAHPEIADRLGKKLSEWCAQLKRPGMPDRYDLERKWYEHYFGVQ
jgi:arylsulfatase A-like enzyme